MRPPAILLVAALLAAGLAGCISQSEPTGNVSEPVDTVENATSGVVNVTVEDTMNFTESVVPTLGYAADLYEPTLEVSETGTIYIAAHVIAAITTGTPAFYSTDDGESWEQLPFAGPAALPPQVHGGSPPPGDEGYIVADDSGGAYMVDITLAGYPVTAWCGDGAEQCYHTPNAYDRAGATATAAPDESSCNAAVSANDRPWAEVANGSLLLVNNPGGGPLQIGRMDVPFDQPTGAPATWNFCASDGGFIPGDAALRDDGRFAVPQYHNGEIHVASGDIQDLQTTDETELFEMQSPMTSAGGINAFSTFDDAGNLYVLAATHSDDEEARFAIAASRDGGGNYTTADFDAGDQPIWQMWIDGNLQGPGALVTWLQDNGTGDHADYYAAHAYLGPDGTPRLENVSVVAERVPMALQGAHVVSSSAGPDGRAYLAGNVNTGTLTEYTGSTPLRAYIQTSGPTLPTGNATAS